jgi:hypothetical protein
MSNGFVIGQPTVVTSSGARCSIWGVIENAVQLEPRFEDYIA